MSMTPSWRSWGLSRDDRSCLQWLFLRWTSSTSRWHGRKAFEGHQWYGLVHNSRPRVIPSKSLSLPTSSRISRHRRSLSENNPLSIETRCDLIAGSSPLWQAWSLCYGPSCPSFGQLCHPNLGSHRIWYIAGDFMSRLTGSWLSSKASMDHWYGLPSSPAVVTCRRLHRDRCMPLGLCRGSFQQQ